MSFSQQRLSSEELRKKAILEIEEPGYVQELEGVSEADKNRIMIRVNQIRGDRERASRILARRARASNGGKKRLTKKGRKVRKRKGTKK